MSTVNARLFLLSISALILSGCDTTMNHYSPNDFVAPNRIVEKKVAVPVLPAVKATYGIGNDPAIVKAYNHYAQTGQMQTVRSNGWMTYPYSTESKPIISCSVNHFCIIQLESGEKLNSLGTGDKNSWLSNVFITGEGPTASVSIQLSPKFNNISTDLTISTNKRTYLIGLVAKPDADTTVLRFYYPEETYIDNLQKAKALQQGDSSSSSNDNDIVSSGTQIDVNHINFNYDIKGDNPPWKPTRVFDDGNKTYIQMPAISSRFDLPVLYLVKNNKMQMVNYRYTQPYFIVDGLFSQAWLVSGKGSEQIRVKIINQNISG